jgi:fused signal recognition particle receptor
VGLFGRLFSKKLASDKPGSVSEQELSDILISADIAPDIAAEIASKLRRAANPKETLKESLLNHAAKLVPKNFEPATSILIVGVNGAGKTTTIGKLAKWFADSGRRVVIGACDTFRAAANEQLDAWAARAGAEIIHGTEPAAVAYKTMEASKDIALLDTAGRLHNRADLMDELSKIVRVMKKLDENAPNETWLVLDGTTGQNALAQIEYFNRAVPLTGLIATKMDGTAKGGFLVSYAAREKNPLPVVYVCHGEKISDLRPFDAKEYVDKIVD